MGIYNIFQIHRLIYSAYCLAIIQYNGWQKEEHSMEVNLVSLWQPVQSSIDQGKYFAIKCNIKNATKLMYWYKIDRHHTHTDSMTNALPGRKHW